MDLLAYTVKHLKENDIIQHNSLEEEIDFLTQKVNELKINNMNLMLITQKL